MEKNGNLDVIVSRNENCQTNVMYFTLYVRLFYNVGHVFGSCVSGFHDPKWHVCPSQVGTLHYDVYTVKVYHKQLPFLFIN